MKERIAGWEIWGYLCRGTARGALKKTQLPCEYGSGDTAGFRYISLMRKSGRWSVFEGSRTVIANLVLVLSTSESRQVVSGFSDNVMSWAKLWDVTLPVPTLNHEARLIRFPSSDIGCSLKSDDVVTKHQFQLQKALICLLIPRQQHSLWKIPDNLLFNHCRCSFTQLWVSESHSYS